MQLTPQTVAVVPPPGPPVSLDYRVAFVLPQSRQLLAVRNNGGIELPHISIPKYSRDALQITTLIEEQWGVKSIVLDVTIDAAVPGFCAIVEIRTPEWQFAQYGFIAVDPDEISADSLGLAERQTITATLLGGHAERGPFSQMGWLDEAYAWIEGSLPGRAKLSTELHQMNASGRFALMRFNSEAGEAYWLKATGKPNEQEFQITRKLAELFPQYLPEIVAMREDWNAWVTKETGAPLRSQLNLPALKIAVTHLARLQKQSVHHLPTLLDAGCIDQRLSVIAFHLDDLFDFIEEAMALQTSTKAKPLEAHQLWELRANVRNACSRLQDMAIPDCLIHLDINPGNILIEGQRCTFIDWAEAYVGNPFLTFEQLCVQATTKHEFAAPWRTRLKELYISEWAELIPAKRIEQALLDAPLVAIAAYLYGRGDWLHSARRNDPNHQSYARSLARHMYKATQTSPELEAICS